MCSSFFYNIKRGFLLMQYHPKACLVRKCLKKDYVWNVITPGETMPWKWIITSLVVWSFHYMDWEIFTRVGKLCPSLRQVATGLRIINCTFWNCLTIPCNCILELPWRQLCILPSRVREALLARTFLLIRTHDQHWKIWSSTDPAG